MNIPTDPQPPSLAALTRATLVAALTALLLLITVVLPAEYGVDPTGLGRRMGFAANANPAGGPCDFRHPARY